MKDVTSIGVETLSGADLLAASLNIDSAYFRQGGRVS